MTKIIKPSTPTYIEVTTRRKARALCNCCGKPLLRARYYCQECHEILFSHICPICGNTFKKRHGRQKYCDNHCRKEIYQCRSPKVGTVAERLLSMIGEERLKQSEVAKELGVSRQYIEQLRDKLGLCQFLSKRQPPKRICPSCGEYKDYTSKFCRKCWIASHYTKLQCIQCGGVFQRRLSEYRASLRNRKTEGFLCSKKCWSTYAGRFFEVGRHKDFKFSLESRKKMRKHDWDLVWETHLKTSYGCSKLSKLLGIPVSTISNILQIIKRERAGTQVKEDSTVSPPTVATVSPVVGNLECPPHRGG